MVSIAGGLPYEAEHFGGSLKALLVVLFVWSELCYVQRDVMKSVGSGAPELPGF